MKTFKTNTDIIQKKFFFQKLNAYKYAMDKKFLSRFPEKRNVLYNNNDRERIAHYIASFGNYFKTL